jgi:hypothetical protein
MKSYVLICVIFLMSNFSYAEDVQGYQFVSKFTAEEVKQYILMNFLYKSIAGNDFKDQVIFAKYIESKFNKKCSNVLLQILSGYNLLHSKSTELRISERSCLDVYFGCRKVSFVNDNALIDNARSFCENDIHNLPSGVYNITVSGHDFIDIPMCESDKYITVDDLQLAENYLAENYFDIFDLDGKSLVISFGTTQGLGVLNKLLFPEFSALNQEMRDKIFKILKKFLNFLNFGYRFDSSIFSFKRNVKLFLRFYINTAVFVNKIPYFKGLSEDDAIFFIVFNDYSVSDLLLHRLIDSELLNELTEYIEKEFGSLSLNLREGIVDMYKHVTFLSKDFINENLTEKKGLKTDISSYIQCLKSSYHFDPQANVNIPIAGGSDENNVNIIHKGFENIIITEDDLKGDTAPSNSIESQVKLYNSTSASESSLSGEKENDKGEIKENDITKHMSLQKEQIYVNTNITGYPLTDAVPDEPFKGNFTDDKNNSSINKNAHDDSSSPTYILSNKNDTTISQGGIGDTTVAVPLSDTKAGTTGGIEIKTNGMTQHTDKEENSAKPNLVNDTSDQQSKELKNNIDNQNTVEVIMESPPKVTSTKSDKSILQPNQIPTNSKSIDLNPTPKHSSASINTSTLTLSNTLSQKPQPGISQESHYQNAKSELVTFQPPMNESEVSSSNSTKESNDIDIKSASKQFNNTVIVTEPHYKDKTLIKPIAATIDFVNNNSPTGEVTTDSAQADNPDNKNYLVIAYNLSILGYNIAYYASLMCLGVCYFVIFKCLFDTCSLYFIENRYKTDWMNYHYLFISLILSLMFNSLISILLYSDILIILVTNPLTYRYTV